MEFKTPHPTLYFGYGSNLWLEQMKMRCPTSTYLGVARLHGYRWIINTRGYANIVEILHKEIEIENENENNISSSPAPNNKYRNVVFGLVYALTDTDERVLDRNEGVPYAYTKEILTCDFWSSKGDGKAVDVSGDPTRREKILVYIDRVRTGKSMPREEYVYRMNRGIRDAVERGVPREYVDGVVRVFVPEEEGAEVEEVAREQARRFVDESGIF
ncbi:hypothetical protein CC78DRAFT_252220 [Lojkania enalia]|uniref:gamma-glutamylcyclotransferase n=1 Tax=Lojkania enalia TaxID=147567 RepID=A0A9P4MZQ8_9PLEO|nr:hypothetical protein CC78DRAFT_252220 [Didymosphaeria enalia]